MSDAIYLLIALLPIVLAIAVDECSENSTFIFTISCISGFVFLIALQVFLAEHDILVGRWFIVSLWILSLVIPGRKIFHHARAKTKQIVRTFLLGFSLLISAFSVWLYPYLRFPSVRHGAPFSNGNNDLAIYVVSGDNFLHRGLQEFGRVVSYFVGRTLNFEGPGSSSLIATVARFTQQSVWRTSNLAMLIVIALTTCCLYVLLRRWSMPILIAMPAAVWMMSASYARLPQQNFFLSQAISRLALILAVIGIDLVIREHDTAQHVRGGVAIAVATWISFVTYPAGTISSGVVLLGLLGGYFLSSWISTATPRVSFKRFVIVGASFLIPIPILLGRWSLVTANVSRYSKTGVSGWPASTSSFAQWIGVSPFLTTWVADLISAVIVAFIIYSLIRLRKTDQPETFLGLLIFFTIACCYCALALKLGSDAYQVWKFLATAQPLALSGLLVFVTNVVRKQNFPQVNYVVHVLVVGLMGLIGINVIRSADTYRTVTQLPSMELETAAKNPLVRSPNLLIRLDPYLETMIAPIILNLHDSLYASDTYLAPALPADSRCTISHTKGASSVEVAKGLYVGPLESCR
ncbi:MAG: hypothetical protein WCP83_03050 [Actinomycetota bacterium]